jgi:hypothetical protein
MNSLSPALGADALTRALQAIHFLCTDVRCSVDHRLGPIALRLMFTQAR